MLCAKVALGAHRGTVKTDIRASRSERVTASASSLSSLSIQHFVVQFLSRV